MIYADTHANALAVASTLAPTAAGFSFGGGVWVHDARDPRPGGAWHCYRLQYAVDPVAVNALEPSKVDALRRDAVSLLDAFPDTLHRLANAGCNHTRLIHEPIESPEGIAAWAYSIFNAATPAQPAAAGEQYPFSVASVSALVPDGFCAIHPDSEGHVAVLPAENRRTRIYWASPGTPYSTRLGHLLGPKHPVSRAAWKGLPSTNLKESA